MSQVGLATTLQELGLADLVGQSAQEVATALVDRLAGPGSTLDATLARIALDKLRRELLGAARTYEDVERLLRQVIDQAQAAGLVVQYYGHYLYERFARDFYERLVKSVGVEKARNSVDSIRRTIFASLRAKVAGRNPLDVHWRGSEGRQLAEQILVETLSIFEAGA